jgi:hypothetical protein
MGRLLLVALSLAAPRARADASAPLPGGQLAFAGRLVDARAAKVLSAPQGAGRCPDDASFPEELARHGAERLKLRGPDETSAVQLTARHALFASFWRVQRPVGAVVDVANGRELHRFTDEPAALIEDARGGVVGLVAIDAKAREVRRLDPDGKVRWRTPVKDLRGDRARVLLDGERLFVAPFERISTGAQLYALDWAGGALRWKGNLREIMAEHSEYMHDVRLSLAGDNLVFEGTESAGCTLQLFDRASGARKLELTETPGGWGR